jgi:hypothetical protein
MNIQILGTVVAPLVQAITSLAGVIGLFLLWHQIKETNKWNRINNQHTMLSNLPSQDLTRQIWTLVEKLPRDSHWRLNTESAPIIYNNISDWVCVKIFLNKIEQLCAAINSTAVDAGYAYKVHGATVVDSFLTFETYIQYARQQSEDATLYLELERVATRWSSLAKAEDKKARAELASLLEQRSA